MWMKDAEIVDAYKNAESKKAQIGILAELNSCDKKDIEKILTDNGVELPKEDNRRKIGSAKAKAEPKTETKVEKSKRKYTRRAKPETVTAPKTEIVSADQEIMEEFHETCVVRSTINNRITELEGYIEAGQKAIEEYKNEIAILQKYIAEKLTL